MPKDIGKTLKECRISSKMSVKDISDLLTQKGYKASESTIYSWENGNSQPTPGALLTMCKAYGVEDVLSTFGYEGYKDDYIALKRDEPNSNNEKVTEERIMLAMDVLNSLSGALSATKNVG